MYPVEYSSIKSFRYSCSNEETSAYKTSVFVFLLDNSSTTESTVEEHLWAVLPRRQTFQTDVCSANEHHFHCHARDRYEQPGGVVCIRKIYPGGNKQGRNHGWKVEGTKAGLGIGCGRGSPPPAVRVRGYHRRKIFDNSDAKYCIMVTTCCEIPCFLKTTAKKSGDQYNVGAPT